MNKSLDSTQIENVTVMSNVIAAIESLRLLETIYGFVSDTGFRIVGIADALTGEQRDSVWDVNWEFQKQYTHIDIEIIPGHLAVVACTAAFTHETASSRCASVPCRAPPIV